MAYAPCHSEIFRKPQVLVYNRSNPLALFIPRRHSPQETAREHIVIYELWRQRNVSYIIPLISDKSDIL